MSMESQIPLVSCVLHSMNPLFIITLVILLVQGYGFQGCVYAYIFSELPVEADSAAAGNSRLPAAAVMPCQVGGVMSLGSDLNCLGEANELTDIIV